MKTTVNINDKLISEAMKVYGIKTKKGIIEMALQELLKRGKMRELAESFGSQKEIKAPPRRKNK
ncbi:type II toxin-antitoxin system VapB family antitoxin [Spirochaetota bacterium]